MKIFMRYILAAVFGVAGVAHFTQADGFSNIVPHYLPFKDFIVKASGVAELIISLLLLVKRPVNFLKTAINSFLVLVLPANIYMAQKALPIGNIDLPNPLLWARV